MVKTVGFILSNAATELFLVSSHNLGKHKLNSLLLDFEFIDYDLHPSKQTL